MYLYIYDSFLSHKKYQNLLNRIESRLTDLEIKGRICRLSALKNLKEIIHDAVGDGVKTIVAVGDDQTFSKTINLIVDAEVTLGLVPINNRSRIAQILGIPPAEQACDILAQRLIKKIDLGKINQQYFLDSAVINDPAVTLEFGKYRITPLSKNSLVNISNLGLLTSSSLVLKNISNPTDGLLEVIVEDSGRGIFNKLKKTVQQSIFPFKKLKVFSKNNPATIIIDQQSIFKTPAEISIIPQKLSVIVGSKRMF